MGLFSSVISWGLCNDFASTNSRLQEGGGRTVSLWSWNGGSREGVPWVLVAEAEARWHIPVSSSCSSGSAAALAFSAAGEDGGQPLGTCLVTAHMLPSLVCKHFKLLKLPFPILTSFIFIGSSFYFYYCGLCSLPNCRTAVVYAGCTWAAGDPPGHCWSGFPLKLLILMIGVVILGLCS